MTAFELALFLGIFIIGFWLFDKAWTWIDALIDAWIYDRLRRREESDAYADPGIPTGRLVDSHAARQQPGAARGPYRRRVADDARVSDHAAGRPRAGVGDVGRQRPRAAATTAPDGLDQHAGCHETTSLVLVKGKR